MTQAHDTTTKDDAPAVGQESDKEEKGDTRVHEKAPHGNKHDDQSSVYDGVGQYLD